MRRGGEVELKAMQSSMVLAIELLLFSKIMQSRYHPKGLGEQNLILARVVKFCFIKRL